MRMIQKEDWESSNLQVKGLGVFESFSPKRCALEYWQFSVVAVESSKVLSEPARPNPHFRDGETEALVEALTEPRPTPSPGTCFGSGAVPGRTGVLETVRSRRCKLPA